MKFSNHIVIANLKKTIPIMVLPFFTFFYGFSQDKNLDFHFETDTVTVEKGTSFLNFLVLENKSTQEINILNLKATEKYPGLLLSTPSQYKLTAGEKKRFPVKFLVNLDFMKMDSTEIEYSLTYTLNQQQQELETSFYIKKDQETRIALYPFSRENYINPSAGESTIAVFVENRGYQSRSVQLTAQSTSAGLELAPEKVQISLESQEKRLVEFKVNLRNSTKFYPDYNIRVKATDLKDNKEVASTYLRIEVLSNQKQLLPRRGLETGKNFVEMAYNQQSSSFNYLQLQGNAEFEIGENFQGRFNTTGNYYLKENKYNFYDTWFELEKKGYRLRLGNVYGNEYDYNVSGRGGKLNAVFGDYKEIEVLAVENDYNLFGNYFPQHQSATIAGAKYEFGKADHHNGKISYVYEHDPRLNIDAQVAHASSSIVLDSIHNFNAEAGLSHEKGLITKDENIGFSTGLNYSTKIKNWDFQSLNSWAGKNYAGLNRGAFDFNQQIGYRFSHKARIFGQYQNAQVHPEYLDFQDAENINNPNYNRYYYYSTQSAQTGVQLSIAKWHFLLSPKFELQQNSNNFMTEKLLAYRFHTKIGTSFNDQSINLSAQYSHAKAESQNEWFNSLKTTLSYSYRAFSLNGSVEINPQNVIDLRSYDVNDKNFMNYNIYTAYSFQAFHNSLNGSLSAGINYSELYQNTNQHFNGNLEYKINRSWAATGYANYSQYKSTESHGYKGDNYQLKIGIKKYFIKNTAPGNHKVQLQLFHDKNFNNIFDNDETAITNQVIYLDDFVAMTDKNGKVTFENVPKGSYKLKINETDGLRLMRNPVIMVDQHKNLKIGLVKKNKVTGKLVEIKQKYDDLETDVRGIIVYAEDKVGEVYSTLVNQNNEFEFFLGNGTYTIYIKNDKYKFLNPSREITIENNDYPQTLIFEYEKKIEKLR